MTEIGREGGFWANIISLTIPIAPLHNPACCHKFDVNMTLQPFDINTTDSKTPASSDFVTFAVWSELKASIMAIAFPSFCNLS